MPVLSRLGITGNKSGLGVVGRLGWGVADQGVSSLSNFGMGILIANVLGAQKFGAFTLAYVTFGVVLNAARGLGTDPLLVRFSGEQSSPWRRAVAASSATATTVGILAGIVVVLLGLLLPGEVGTAFLALGIGLPGLMLQDSCRFAFFSSGHAAKAVVNDSLWGLLQFGTIVALVLTDSASVGTCLLAFGGTATLAGLVGLLQIGIAPAPTQVRAWLRDHVDLGGRYLVENISISGARQLRMIALGGIVGLAAVGQVRAAEMLMGPFLVILMGVSQVAVPEAVQVVRRSPRTLGRFCLLIGGVQALAAAVWGVAIVVLLPLGPGPALLGDLWAPASVLLVPVAIQMVIAGFEIGAAAGVRALGASRRSLKAQLINAALYLSGGTVGAALGGVQGTCWGVAGATLFGTCAWWYQLQLARAEHVPLKNSPSAPVGP